MPGPSEVWALRRWRLASFLEDTEAKARCSVSTCRCSSWEARPAGSVTEGEEGALRVSGARLLRVRV